jgi:hypothetical protein
MKCVEDKKTFTLAPGRMLLTQFNLWRRLVCFPVAATMLVALHAAGQTSVLTQHNDIGRTGQNTAETILNTSNVNVSHFGKLFSFPVKGQVYAQPLYVYGVTIKGSVHNVLIAVTENDLVYAFDADVPSTTPLWTVDLVDTAHGAGPGETAMATDVLSGCTDMVPYAGITSTPVIDPLAGPGPGTIYVEAKSTDGTNYFHRLHALDLTTGAELSQGPAVITATVSGTGDGSSGGQLTFDPLYQNNRPGLLLLNGSIYIGYASHCDYSPYHGWIFAYNASTFAQQSVFVTTPNGGLGGFWMSGAGLAADASNYIYTASGNGDFDTTNVPATELGDTVMKLGTTSGNLSLQDYFTPSDELCLSNNDNDLGSGGVLVLPDQPGADKHILVAAGKEGAIYVVNRDGMTNQNVHFENSNNCTTSDPEILEESASGAIGGMWSMPAYWNSTLYYWGAGDVLRAFPLVNGSPQLNNPATNSTSLNWPGATPSISSNGTTAGTSILWAVDSSQNATNGANSGPAVLHAINATNINKELWNSTQATGNRDMAGNAVKFTVPTVVNGKVYIGAASEVDAYGLFTGAVLTSPAPSSTLAGGPVTFTWTPGTGATGYALWIGSTGAGSDNLYYSGEKASTVTSLTVSGLPVNGETIYVRLITYYGSSSTFNSYTYTSSTGGTAILTMPAPGSTLPGGPVTFTWTSASGATGYALWAGTTGTGSGSDNLYYSGEQASTVTSLSVSGLPANGQTIYVRLITYYGSSSSFINYTYTAATGAALTTPAPGSTLTGPNVTFNWSSVANATGYALWAGTTGTGSGSDNLYYSGEKASTVTSLAVTGLPVNGETIYIRLITYYGTASAFTTYSYTSTTGGILTTPAPSSTLTGPSITFSWTAGAGATGYALWIGSTGPGSDNLYYSGEKASTVTSLTVNGLPVNGETIYVRLITYYGSNSGFINYTYTAAP